MRMQLSCSLLLLWSMGCSSQETATQAPKPVLNEFNSALAGLERAIDTAVSNDSNERAEHADDILDRVGELEESVSELVFRARDKTAAQETLNAMTQTLSDARKAAEGALDLEKLRAEIRKLKAQADELQPKLL